VKRDHFVTLIDVVNMQILAAKPARVPASVLP